MRARWIFTIEHDPANKPGILASHIFVPTPEVVEELGRLGNLPVAMSSSSPRRVLRVELFEDDPSLNLLVRAIEDKLGFAPGPSFITPPERRDRFYAVRKIREYSKKNYDAASFLMLLAGKVIASQKDGTTEQVEKEVYVVEADRFQSSKTQLGVIMPFHANCVTESLGRQLENAGLRGLSLEPVVVLPANKVKKPLVKLSSTFVAPRSLLSMVNSPGHLVEPNTEWPCYLDDGGYQPYEFKYRQSDMKRFEAVDIAMSYERTGPTKARAYRWCIVSQRFRQVMAALKVPGVSYAPVRFVE